MITSRKRRRLVARGQALLAAMLVALLPVATLASFGAKADAVTSVGERMHAAIDAAFVAYDPDYHQNKARYGVRLDSIAERLAAAEAAGLPLYCAQQMYLEARWLHRYTARWAALEDKLHRTELSLSDPDQAFAREQSPVTGEWGICYENQILRWGETAVELERLASLGAVPRYPLRLTLGTGKSLLRALQDLLVSDIARTGIDRRGELGNLLTALAQTSFKPHLRDMLPGFVQHAPHVGPDTLREVFRFFLAGAQDPLTGYWGAWYLFDVKIVKTADLSFTFHIIKYSKGDVARWPQIIDTTLAIADHPYPYGWRSGGSWNNHNLYDVAAILRYGWAHMSEEQKILAREKLEAMLDWSLNATVNAEGGLKNDVGRSDSLADVHYFGVSFYDIIGYWQKERRFWIDEIPAHLAGRADCGRIHRDLIAFDFPGWAGDGAIAKIAKNCAPDDPSGG